MKNPFLHKLMVGAALLSLAASCASEDDEVNGNVCASSETSYQNYAAGLTQAGDKGLFTVKLTTANPAPPNRGDNSWTIQVLDSGGSPAPDATISKVTPFMPEHGHGTSVAPVIADADADAKTIVSSIDLMMAGVWTITVEVQSGDQNDSAIFAFCIDG